MRYVQIGGALVFGVLVIFGAFYMRGVQNNPAGTASIEVVPPKDNLFTFIPERD